VADVSSTVEYSTVPCTYLLLCPPNWRLCPAGDSRGARAVDAGGSGLPVAALLVHFGDARGGGAPGGPGAASLLGELRSGAGGGRRHGHALSGTVLYCTALYCTALYCIVLCCTVLVSTLLYLTVENTMYCILLCFCVVHCDVLYCIVLFCTAKYYYVLLPRTELFCDQVFWAVHLSALCFTRFEAWFPRACYSCCRQCKGSTERLECASRSGHTSMVCSLWGFFFLYRS